MFELDQGHNNLDHWAMKTCKLGHEFETQKRCPVCAKAYCAANRDRMIAATAARYAKKAKRAARRRERRIENPSLCANCFRRAPSEGRKICSPCRQSQLRWRLSKKYGLPAGKYEEMLIEQAGRCAICLGPMTGTREPAVDHDHACCPGQRSCGRCVRGLLCRRCNSILGYARDDSNVLHAALAYLSESSQK